MPRRHDDVVRQLIDDLARGVYPAGRRLPTEQELAELLGTGRSTIREALRTLEDRRMLEVRAGKGQYARPDDRWKLGDLEVLLTTLESGRDPELLREAIDARTIIEMSSAERVCTRAAAGDLTLLRDRVEGMERASGSTERSGGIEDPFVQSEADFHHALLLVGGNRVLASVAEPMHTVLATIRLRHAPEQEHAVIGQHRRILEGVSSRDPDLAVSSVQGYGRRLQRWLAQR